MVVTTNSYGATLILNSSSIFRQQLSTAKTYATVDKLGLDLLGQMSADSNTPFMFALYLAKTGAPTNFSFTLNTSPSRGEPSVGTDCILLWSGWSAFSLSVANPFSLHVDVNPQASGNYELWLAAQNVVGPTVAGYLGIGVTVHANLTTCVNIVEVQGISQGPGLLYTSLQEVDATVNVNTKIKDGSGGTGVAAVSNAGVLSVSGGGGTSSSVYLTDSTGAVAVKVTPNGSLVMAPGR